MHLKIIGMNISKTFTPFRIDLSMHVWSGNILMKMHMALGDR